MVDPTHNAGTGAEGAGRETAILNDRILARLEVLGLLEDPEMAQEVIDVFVYDAAQSLDELGRAIQAGDAPNCERLAHRLKGSSLNLGIDELGSLARSLEEKSRSGNLQGATEIFGTMRQLHATLSSVSHQILPKAA
jgi:two-component system, sensor histidine kinase and response regulator